MKTKCRSLWLGNRAYTEAWMLQRKLVERRLADEIPDTLVLLEHPPTITLGRATRENHIIASSEQLLHHGISVVETDRGGDVTYHGPGQLVGYPILNLQQPPHQPDLHLYLRNLEETLIRALAMYGVVAGRFPPYTGVWTGLETPHPEKIAAIGVKASRWITQHGFALNVHTNLSHFDLIVPCGIRDYGVTSLSQILGREVAVSEIIPAVTSCFLDVFGYEPDNRVHRRNCFFSDQDPRRNIGHGFAGQPEEGDICGNL